MYSDAQIRSKLFVRLMYSRGKNVKFRKLFKYIV